MFHNLFTNIYTYWSVVFFLVFSLLFFCFVQSMNISRREREWDREIVIDRERERERVSSSLCLDSSWRKFPQAIKVKVLHSYFIFFELLFLFFLPHLSRRFPHSSIVCTSKSLIAFSIIFYQYIYFIMYTFFSCFFFYLIYTLNILFLLD